MSAIGSANTPVHVNERSVAKAGNSIPSTSVTPDFTTGLKVATIVVNGAISDIKVPAATSSALGAVKVPANRNIVVDANGNLDVPMQITQNVTTGTALAKISANGLGDVDIYAPTATGDNLGLVKIGSGINVNKGTISVNLPTVPSAGFLLVDSGGTRKVRNNIQETSIPVSTGSVAPIGIRKDASGNAQLELYTLPAQVTVPSFNTSNVISGGYTEVLPYWGYSLTSGEFTKDSAHNYDKTDHGNYPSSEGASVTIGNITITRKDADDVYWYDVAIPTWADGSIRLLTVDFCCDGSHESLSDMRVWLINGSSAVNIAKVHSFSFGYKSSGEQVNTNEYSSYQGILPMKSGVNLRFVSHSKIRHMHVLLFN